MEAAEECLVCGVPEVQQDRANNVSLLSVLAALLGQELGLEPLPSCALCQRCCHLLSEAANLQQRLDHIKGTILGVYRPVQYHGSISTPFPSASCALPVPARQTLLGSAPTQVAHPGAEQIHVMPDTMPATTPTSTVTPTAAAAATARSKAGGAETGSKVASGAAAAGSARRLPCPVCGKSVTARYLRTHQRQHSGERPFTCSLCPRSFVKSSDLSIHRRRHAGDKRHRCSLCPASFFFPYELALHKHRHSETRPFLCPECGTGFFSRAGLLRHQRVDHPDQCVDSQTGDAPRQKACGHCGKKFACDRSLRRHERAHTAGKRYMCEECGVTYKSSTALRFHTRRQHDGERPYQCEVCGSQFITRSVWLRHLRVHTGEAPFRCQFCGADYKDKQKLKRHYANKHAAEVAKVGADNLQYSAGTGAKPAVTATGVGAGERRDVGMKQPLQTPVTTCHVSDLEPAQVDQGHLVQGQGQQVSDPDWHQQSWKETMQAEQAYGDASAAATEHGNNGAMQSQEMAPVELMPDSAVLPQGMLYEAQSALFSYF